MRCTSTHTLFAKVSPAIFYTPLFVLKIHHSWPVATYPSTCQVLSCVFLVTGLKPVHAQAMLASQLSAFVVCVAGGRAETHANQAKPAQQSSHSSEVCTRVLCHLSGTLSSSEGGLACSVISCQASVNSIACILLATFYCQQWACLRTCWLRCGHCRPCYCDCIMYFTLVRACVASTQVILLQSCITHLAVVVELNSVCCNPSHTTLSSCLPGNFS